MPSAPVLVALYLAVVVGAAASPALLYLLLGRGFPARRALRLTVLVSASLLLVAVAPFLLFLAGLAGLAGYAGLAGLAAIMLTQYLFAPHLVLRGLRLRRPGPGEEWLLHVLAELRQRAGYSKPVELYIADDPVPNAFAVSSPLRRAIVVNEGLLRHLARDEVRAVLAHELGHIVHHDTGYMAATSFAPSAVYLLGVSAVIAGTLMIRASAAVAAAAGATGGDEEAAGVAGLTALGGVFAGLAAILVGLLLALSSLIVNLAILGFSRIREHLADASSVELTGGTAIVPALTKIEKVIQEMKRMEQQRAQAALTPRIRNMLYIVPRIYANLYRSAHGLYPEPLKWLAPLSTHPPLQARSYVAHRVHQELFSARQRGYHGAALGLPRG